MICAVVSFFHLYWMPNKDRWKTILIMWKNCFETSARWVNKSFHFIATYSKPIDLIHPTLLFQQTNDDLSWYVKNCLNSPSISIPVECCSWCQQIFLFEKWTKQLSRFLWKVQVLCQVIEFCFCQGYWLVILFWLACIIPTYNSYVTMFRIRAILHVTIWTRNRKVWNMVLWQKEHWCIGHGACSCDLFLLDLSCKNSSP